MSEHDALVGSYVHLAHYGREKEALHILKRVASMVKPIMRVRKWKVGELAEFYPDEPSLLGLNINGGQKICLRLRHAGDKSQFMPLESIIDTMLHELSHIVWGPHDAKFHALWDQLRDEYQGLLLKGYTGEGFLTQGQRLGGTRMPRHEARRLAREAAEKRQRVRSQPGPGQRLGGLAPRPGEDIRRVIAEAAEKRTRTLRGCGTDMLSKAQAESIGNTATRNGFRTQGEEDEANEAAIAQALWELVQEDEQAKYGSSYIPPSAENPAGSNGGGFTTPTGKGSSNQPSQQAEASTWTCQVCTLLNPSNFLCCDACGVERFEGGVMDVAAPMTAPMTAPSSSRRSGSPTGLGPRNAIDLTKSPPKRERRPESKTTASSEASVASSSRPAVWYCSFCGTEMERQWWTCFTCGKVKDSSR